MFNKKNKGEDIRPVNLISLVDQSSVIAEQYRTVRTSIQFSMVDDNVKSIIITSAGAGEGKSTTSANLAVVFANSGYKVLLVDSDLRNPTVHKTFRVVNGKGFSTLLADRDLQPEDVIHKTIIDNLDVLPSGPLPPNPSELLGTKRSEEVVKELEGRYDLVIYDMPPIVAVTDAQIMATKTDGVLIVARQKKTQKASLAKAKNLLDIVNAKIIGVVMNGLENESNSEYYYSYTSAKD